MLEAEIAARGLQDRVRLHGFVDHEQKVELLQRAWALVTASAAEGWGLTTLEAAACGTPSVAFGIGGLAEAIEHERTGLLARDSADMVVQTRRILDDAELRERLGANALRRAHRARLAPHGRSDARRARGAAGGRPVDARGRLRPRRKAWRHAAAPRRALGCTASNAEGE